MAARRREEGAPAVGVALSALLHLAVVGGLVWWGLRDKPAEPLAQGLELIWDPPTELGLAGEGAATPGAPPEVPAPGAEAAAPEAPAAPPVLAAPPVTALPPVAAAPPVPPRPPAPPPTAVAAMPRTPPPPAPLLPSAADAPLPPPQVMPSPPTQEMVAEQPAEPESLTAAAPDVRVPPLSLPQPSPPPRRPAPRTQQARPSRPTQAPPGGGGQAETQATASAGGAAFLGVTSAPSPDSNFPRPDPTYPESSRLRGEQGVVSVSMTIGPDGRVQAVRIIRSSGYPALDESARRAILTTWRFRPALREGEPVVGSMDTSIRFNLQ